MSATYKELKREENKQQVFNDIKSDGYRLLQEGKIDEGVDGGAAIVMSFGGVM